MAVQLNNRVDIVLHEDLETSDIIVVRLRTMCCIVSCSRDDIQRSASVALRTSCAQPRRSGSDAMYPILSFLLQEEEKSIG